MTTWLSTDEAARHLGIPSDTLRGMMGGTTAQPAWVLYAGVFGTKSARYRWRADRLDSWFEEVCAWRASSSEGTSGSSGGGTADEGAEPTSSPGPRSAQPKRSRTRSSGRSSGTGDTSLLEELARRR